MTATIKLMVNSGSGVLAAVVSRLQAAGLRVKSHNLEPVNASSSILTVHAEVRDDFDAAELKSMLSGIEVVQGVEEISAGNRAPERQQPGVAVPEELVNRVVASFPKIMAPIQNFEEKTAKDPQRVDKLRQLGVEAGRKLVADLEHGPLDSLPAVIDEVVLPGISSIAEASRDGNSVVVPVSLFTRRVVTSMDLFSGDGENCYFLAGFVEGLVTSSPGHDAVSVMESKCRANGDPACVFNLS